ncbi:MAG: site-2 protease family protein [bacterium]
MTGPTSEEAKRLANLHAVLESMQASQRAARPASPPQAEPRPGEPAPSHRARNSAMGAGAAAVAAVLGKLKFLGILASVLKLNTLVSMVLSIALYATQWGLPFAIGFVLLIFVHELGHAIVMRHEGVPAGAPVFIPFLGAVIAMRGRPRNAYVEAKVAIGGPVLGSLGAWAVLAAGLWTRHPLLVSLGHTGVLINLFNLIPVSPLDGGRIAGAFTRTFWVVGYALGVVALVLTRSPILFLVLIVGLFTLWQRWRRPIPGYDEIPRAQRLAVGLGYAALTIALVMSLSLTATVPD